MTVNKDDLPYRPCAGIMLANTEGKVFVGQRLDSAPEGDAWQMPQGGIDDDEDAQDAALRELFEETGIAAHLVDIIARSRDEHFYDLPDDLIGKIWKGKYRGQRQHWFLMRFKGTDTDINVETEHQEFSRWQWVDPKTLPQLIVPFKRRLYENILGEFADLI
nr:RNA pyrophosphohydrolase [uncultured Sphingorhabdus sp.]